MVSSKQCLLSSQTTCLQLCAETEEGATRILDHNTGLFTVAVCVMSNFSKSRVLALQLLTRLCSLSGGHDNVADSMSMLRLKFGEPVRFKFLVGKLIFAQMLNESSNKLHFKECSTAGTGHLSKFLVSASSTPLSRQLLQRRNRFRFNVNWRRLALKFPCLSWSTAR